MISLAKNAADIDQKNPRVPFAAGSAHLALRQNAEAVKAFTQVVELEPKNVGAYNRRGDANFKLGNFKDAIADYDEYLKATPKEAPEHWKRGIAALLRGPVQGRCRSVRTAPQSEPGRRGERGLALPV